MFSSRPAGATNEVDLTCRSRQQSFGSPFLSWTEKRLTYEFVFLSYLHSMCSEAWNKVLSLSLASLFAVILQCHGQVIFLEEGAQFLHQSSAYLGDDWQELELAVVNTTSSPQEIIFTRSFVDSELGLNALERFCVGQTCYLPGNFSSAPTMLSAYGSVIFKPNYFPGFDEGDVQMSYCVHGLGQEAASGSCVNVTFSYRLNGYVSGCTNPDALNFNPEATIDDGNCDIPSLDCTDAYNSWFAEGYEAGQIEIGYCAGDLDFDGTVSVPDMLLFLSRFGDFCSN